VTPEPVIEYLNVLKDIQPGLSVSFILAMENQFGFEGAKETFGRRVVVTITGTAHTSNHLGFRQQSLVVRAGILAAPVRVVDQARSRLTVDQSHL
jgi:hypothetical protein